MPAAATDKFQKVAIATATTLDAPGYTIGNTSVTVASTSTWPTDTGITFAIDEVDANGDRVANSYNEYVGTVASGTSVTNVSHVNGTDRNYSAGATTRVYIPVSEERENRLVEGIVVEHNQDGTHDEALITSRTADTSPASGDLLLTSDVSASNALKKVTIANLFANIPAGSVEAADVANGFAVQTVGTAFSAVATGTTTIPLDDTIPQNTEGTEFMTQAITPKATTNILVIDVIAFLSSDGTSDTIGALFQDTTANAVAAGIFFESTSTARQMLTLRHIMAAGTTSATTFKFRAGPPTAATVTFNGNSGTRLFGAITKSSIVITEYKA